MLSGVGAVKKDALNDSKDSWNVDDVKNIMLGEPKKEPDLAPKALFGAPEKPAVTMKADEPLKKNLFGSLGPKKEEEKKA